MIITEDVDDLPPISKALAELNSETMYREAHRQYTFLNGRRQNALGGEARGPNNLSSDIKLASYYQRQFDEATDALDEWEKHKLLTICFAYKSRAGVLQYLKLLEGSQWEWVPLFTNLVVNYGVDSAFVAASQQLSIPSDVRTPSTRAKRRAHFKKAIPETATFTTVSIHPRPYFVIPTLPLAFPTRFFAALVQLAPIQQLTIPRLLSYPAVLQLALYHPLKEYLGSNLPSYWIRKLPSNAGEEHPEFRSWITFFDHLLDGNEILWPVSSTRQNQNRIAGDFVEAGRGDGYDEEDLKMWLAGWRADRQSVGMKEKGEEEMLKIKRSLTQVGAGDENKENDRPDEDSVMVDVDVDGDGGEVVELVETARKSVSWSENLERVKEIPQRGKTSRSLVV
ncbi:hypothetical protein BDV96DRAFT_256952 [Lophiotrema nucula]|uniref:Uncharacterized protein n=1 Tax=Lophiotrema nucula TaxID=690887 RepID=A0A6A5YN45_9PLEO|nr:hypothetical protein BDV96DRAFT_256952 [Lophiotrema nucula]